MPQARKYTSVAEKQQAYRRRKQQADTQADRTPGYAVWRRDLREASDIVNRVYEEIHYWMQERSERWQDSERAGEMEADKDKLEEISDAIGGLYILEKGAKR